MRREGELARQWLARAASDPRAAQMMVAAAPALTVEACFHCQPTVEKAFKARLLFGGVAFKKSHDLAYLAKLCAEIDAAFEPWVGKCDALTEYAARVRYPEQEAPTLRQAQTATAIANDAYRFVLSRFPDEAQPSSPT